MLKNPTYEVLKMKVLMRPNLHGGFHERARGLARDIARQKVKILNFSGFVVLLYVKKFAKFQDF